MSVIISNLPSYTGSATDLRWFVMNNSGETETFKYSGYSSQLIPGQAAGSYITPGSTAGSNSLAIGDGNTAGGGQSFVIGYNNTDNSNNRITVFGAGNNIGSAWSVGIGYGNDLVGNNWSSESILIGYENTIGGTGVNTGNINIGQSQTISDGSYNTILNGKSNALQGGNYNNIFNGSGNTIGSSYSGVSMLSCFGRTADVSNTTYVENIKGFGKSTQFNSLGGTGNTETANSYSNFIVGTGNTVGNVSTQHVVFGEGNTSTGGADSVGAFVFGKNNSTTNASQRWGAVFGAYNNLGASTGYIFGVNNLNLGLGSICIGENHVLAGDNSIAIGEGNRVITSYNYSVGIDNDIEAGNYNGMYGGNKMRNNSGSYNGFLGGLSNINNTSSYGGFIGGESNTITGSGNRNVMVGGSGNTISGKTDVVMLGTTGRTASASTTTYTENLHVYRTPSTEVQPVSSGTTFTCNLENGGKAQYYITGTSTVNITNVRDGASFMIKTQTDGNYVMTWTATGGYTFVFEGGIKDPGNTTTDIFVFEVFGSVIYGSRRHNFS